VFYAVTSRKTNALYTKAFEKVKELVFSPFVLGTTFSTPALSTPAMSTPAISTVPSCPLPRFQSPRACRPTSVCPSVSVCPVRASNWKTTKRIKKTKLARTFPRAGVTGVPIFRLRGQRSRSPDVRKRPENDACLVYRRLGLICRGRLQRQPI